VAGKAETDVRSCFLLSSRCRTDLLLHSFNLTLFTNLRYAIMVSPATVSSPPATVNGSYQVLFMWGILGLSIIIVTVLLVCTPLGQPLKRRLQRLGSGSSKAEQSTRELEAHTFEFRSPHMVGTPAPPYEWVLRITPPAPPTAHLSSPNDVAHVAPTLTHRFSEISRAPSGHGLGFQAEESSVGEKKGLEDSLEQEKTKDIHFDRAPDYSEPTPDPFVSKPVHVSPSRPLSVAEVGRVEAPAATEFELQTRRDRSRALLLQSDVRARRELLRSMSEEDRMYALGH